MVSTPMIKKIAEQKQQIRNQSRKVRQALSENQQYKASKQCCQLLIQSEILEGPNKFALYLANDGELDPKALIDYLWEQGREVYLPVINGKILKFAHYYSETVLNNNKYGIPEPIHSKYCDIEDLDLLFMPLVAFDDSGQRLGMGGGFYDRSLEGHPNLKTIGLAHQFQQQDRIPTEPWDKSLHIIATPEKIYSF